MSCLIKQNGKGIWFWLTKFIPIIYLTILPRARIGYEMVDSQRGTQRRDIIIISNKRKWNNCFIKNNQEIFLDLADFAL